ncbi:Uncharacterized protein PBTT_03836 [Plasmodiophora brassicae]|uniref:Uncharacterized protein n=1 Tax=Plasmodiophora brassicae TaxID=37360 RepID=A0A3P3Y739_PLABS|nr:unnamed protein product [Plasmodiophora brassicae]
MRALSTVAIWVAALAICLASSHSPTLVKVESESTAGAADEEEAIRQIIAGGVEMNQTSERSGTARIHVPMVRNGTERPVTIDLKLSVAPTKVLKQETTEIPVDDSIQDDGRRHAESDVERSGAGEYSKKPHLTRSLDRLASESDGDLRTENHQSKSSSGHRNVSSSSNRRPNHSESGATKGSRSRSSVVPSSSEKSGPRSRSGKADPTKAKRTKRSSDESNGGSSSTTTSSSTSKRSVDVWVASDGTILQPPTSSSSSSTSESDSVEFVSSSHSGGALKKMLGSRSSSGSRDAALVPNLGITPCLDMKDGVCRAR